MSNHPFPARHHVWWFALALILLACGPAQSPEQRLQLTLKEMRDAAVAGQIGGFLERVAEDFSGQGGSYDQRALASLLRVQLLKHSRVTATIVSSEYEMFEGRATIDLKVLMTGGPKAWLPDSGRVYQIRTGWREDERQWVLISAQWE